MSTFQFIWIFRFFWLVLRNAGKKYFTDHGPFLASGLAFDLLLYCLPLPFLFVSTLGYTVVGSDRALAWVQEAIERLLPASREIFLDILSSIVANRTLLGFTGFFLFLIFSTSVFSSSRHILNTVFMAQTSRPFFKGKGVDLLMMAGMSVLLILTVAFRSSVAFAETFYDRLPLIGELLQPFWFIVGHGLGFLFPATLFYFLYHFSPTKRLRQGALVVGSLSGAGLFELSKPLFSWYVSVAQPVTTLYGALSVLIFFLLWLYFASTVFILGAEVGWAYEQANRKEHG